MKTVKTMIFFFVIFLNSLILGTGIYDLGRSAPCLDMQGTTPLKTYKLHFKTQWRIVDLRRSMFWSILI